MLTTTHKFTPQTHKALFQEIKIGDLILPSRVFMAPLTRSRSKAPEHTQTPLHALYYSQRASAGLIVSEATQISRQGQGYAWTPGIFTDEQVESWKLVTDAVHNAGGHIFCQLWHVGAVSHSVFQPNQSQPVSSSPWTPAGEAFVGSYHPDGPTLPHPEARALTKGEIEQLLDDYKAAADCATKAGFDGVELHAANGYLIDQFLRDSVNRRDDEYGGSIENRMRILIEIVEALSSVIHHSRIGVRLSPMGGPGGSSDSNPEAVYTAVAQALSKKGMAYLHVVRPNSHENNLEKQALGNAILKKMRTAFVGPFVANGEFTPQEAAQWIESGHADAIAFGRLFLANPDLPQRIANGGPFKDPDYATFYGGNHKGYTDYATLHRTRSHL